MLTLRSYQVEGLEKVEAAVGAGARRVLLAWATGLGKTVAFAEFIRRRSHGHALVLAHRDELILQAASKLSDVIGGKASIGIVKAERNECDADIVVASVQTVCRPNRLRELCKRRWSTIIVDEAHHSLAESYLRVLQELGALDEQTEVVTLGVTATPERGDKKSLSAIWQQISHHMSIYQGIKGGYLSRLRAAVVKLQYDPNKIRSSHGDLREDDSARLLMEANAPVHIVQSIKTIVPERQTLVFTPTVEVAHAVVAECRQQGVTAAAVDASTKVEDRRRILRGFHDGEIQVLSNCGVLTEGYDEEKIGAVVLARPTKSAPLYIQMVGRGTRLHPEKEDCMLIDVAGNVYRHDLCQVMDLLPDVIGDDVPVYTVNDGMVVPVPSVVTEEVPDEDAELDITPVDLFSERPFAWVKTNFGYVLELGSRERVSLQQTAYGWEVGLWSGNTYDVIWEGAAFGYAQGRAEDLVRERGGAALARRSAAWRENPTTSGQRTACTKWFVSCGRTAGETSDILARVIAEAEFRRRLRQQQQQQVG